MLNRLALAFAALLMLPGAAAAETLEGSWALRISDTTIFRFDLRQNGEGEWSGVWARPRSYRNNGVIFSNLEGQAEVTSRNASEQGDALRLTFADPRPRSLPQAFRFRVAGEGRTELTFVDTGFAPLPLVRVAPDTEVGPFDKSRLYDRDNAQTSPEARAQPVQELPATAAPAPRVSREGQGELPPVATPAAQGVAQPTAPAPGAPQSGAWQPDPSVSAAIAARAAALDGASRSAAVEPRAEPERPAAPAAPQSSPGAQQGGAWQPDPSVRAAIAARAAVLNGSAEAAGASEANPDGRVGSDFLDGL